MKRISISIVSVAMVLIIFFPVFVIFEWAFSTIWYGTSLFPTQLGFRSFIQVIQAGLGKSLILSFTIAPLVVLFSALISIPAAYIIGTKDIKSKKLIENLFLIPLIVPPIVSGIGILSIYTQLGLIGNYMAIVLVHMIGATPYMFRSVEASFESIDPSIEEAARVLGATRLRTILRIYLPLVTPGLLSGSVFAFSWSLNEFLLTLLLGLPNIVTLPVFLYRYVGGYYISPGPASAISVFLIVPSLFIVYLMEKYIKSEYVAGAGIKG
ncbi:MAG: hypothetical protein C0176_01830 [Mesoaciditoga sp.]|uniref:ABC transporter permease n=1 Tax=Athalassotoga sp. TaxID=2022597 RepID=UPI000CB5DD0F|nr:MAG: hypothetical protein C0185_02420 [Mesoaciditoga sp.]PMP80409.1 MAG: hypothetical protein C0176_01830 [Mesoaciditoga sp.]HEU23567.1 ABC transporter permease subunit [Mesoaciditoga lauensis]